MSDKKASAGSRIVTALAGALAAYITRKTLRFAWTRITGKEPPHPEDPEAPLGEALIWGIVVGAGIHTSRLLAIKATARRPDSDGS